MLYVTTRNRFDTYTVQWAVTHDTASDGGLFVPMQWPVFSREELGTLGKQSLYTTVARVLNSFFSVKLTEQDIRFAVGKTTVNFVTMSHRLLLAELWHNSAGDFFATVDKIACRLAQDYTGARATNWVRIAVSIGFLCGIFGHLMAQNLADPENPLDVAVESGDFTLPMAAWYSRQMGLPIRNIVCGCNENGAPWELLHKGELRTGAPLVKTSTPLADFALPVGLERLISATLGYDEACAYAAVCCRGGVYAPQVERWNILRQGMLASIAGDQRIENLVANVYRANSYVLGPYSALAYAGLMDHRAGAGGNTTALVLCRRSCLPEGEWMQRVLGVAGDRLPQLTQLQ